MAARKVSKTGAGAGGAGPERSAAAEPPTETTPDHAATAAPTSTTGTAVLDAEASKAAGKAPRSARGTKATVKKDPTTTKKPKGAAGPVTPAPHPPDGAEFLTDTEWLEQQRATLLAERAQYTRSAESLAAEAASLMADREPGDVQFDEESGEGDTLAVERDRDLALSAAARESVDQIDKALARIADGTYGICVVGGDVIPKERLEAIPEASVCVVHKVQSFG